MEENKVQETTDKLLSNQAEMKYWRFQEKRKLKY